MSRLALPYRVPPSSAIKAEEWQLVVDDESVPLPEAVGDWDYQMNLELQRTVHVDLPGIRAGAGLPDDALLTLAGIWTATGSNLRGALERVPLTGGGVQEVHLRGRLSGTDLGGLLTLDTVLVLSRIGSTALPFAPHRAGSLLWGDQAALRLQGDAPQFPVSIVDFAHTSFPEKAAWHLQIGARLEAAAMGSLLLLVNERNGMVVEAFKNAARPRPLDRAVLSTVYADCARVMLEHAFSHEEFDDDVEFADDSLGATLLNLFHRTFPGGTIRDLRMRRDHSPNLFATELQSAVGIFKEA